jgi:DNA invertase Pin-like site-specific DNA recombinase
MPRPKFSPTGDQRRAIEAVRKAARERERNLARIDEPLDKALAKAAAKHVPISVLAEVLGVGRDTVYRHLGREA